MTNKSFTVNLNFAWITDGASSQFREFADLYESSFPEDEREATDRFQEWIVPTDPDNIPETGANYLLGAIYESRLSGFIFYTFMPNPCFAFFVYIAVRPELRGRGIATALFKEAEVHCTNLAKQLDTQLLAVVGEVERIEDATEPTEIERRILRLALFDRLGLSILSSGYVQPALRADSEPVPLNLMWKPTAPNVDTSKLIEAFYLLVFDLPPNDPFVERTIAEIRT